jgi:hypothetical protein
MKVDRVKLTVEVPTPMGNQWIGLEGSIGENEDEKMALTQLRNTINAWAYPSATGTLPMPPPYGPSQEMPVINKAEERIGIDIENAKSKDELMGFKDKLTTPYLADLFSSKLQQLSLNK